MKTLNSILLILGLLLIGCNKEDEILNTQGPAPVITAISPDKGKSGTEVSIMGSNFGADLKENTVTFNGVASTVTAASATELTAEVPSVAGSGAVEVTVNNQKAIGPQFTWLPDNGRYVDGINGNDQNGANTCEDPDFPCSTISQAIAVSFGGDIIEIADAEYTESLVVDKSLTLKGESEVNTIIQAHENQSGAQGRVITIEEGIIADISELTIRYGRAIDASPDRTGGGMHTMRGSSVTLLNITFSNNKAIKGGGMFNWESTCNLTNVTFNENMAETTGGGMFNEYCSPILTNVVFNENRAYGGGGMHNKTLSSPILTNVVFQSNTAGYKGGGMSNESSTPTLIDVDFINNKAGSTGEVGEKGGGMFNDNSDPILTRVLFENNQAEDHGGGMYNYLSSPVLTDIQFNENTASLGGGMSNQDSSPTLTNVVFTENTGSLHGGGIRNENESSPLLTNVVFWKNQATQGGGMFNGNASAPILINVTFSGNTASIGGGLANYTGSKPMLLNSIVWGNTAGTANEIYNGNQGAISIHYSLFRDGAADITEGLEFINENFQTVDPLFVDPAIGNLLLQENSPAINAGDPTTDLSLFPGGPNSPIDLDGNSRVIDGGIDLGAYENQNN